ncbi:BamA/TamA family outer membrane protein [Labilibacter marinus]|uniref:BamA/TamA family outer membrane protein n=1 Tax=Labilibacter marinus TaxID=1477105 RepID=UPI00082C4E09|nr:BamA/TamA family outer membrane protein [Labilibacter marinus]
MIIRYLTLTLICTYSLLCYGQKSDIKNRAIETDTLGFKNVSTLLVPIAFYSPETNFAFGGGGQMFFKTRRSNSQVLNSTILASAIYTLNKQLIIEVQPQLYFNYENYFLDTKFRYKVFPNQFWGVGPSTPDLSEENYNQTEVSLSATFVKSLPSNVNFGFAFNFSDFNVTEIQEGGILDSGQIEGAKGATLVGVGIVLNLDSRDNKFSPLKGGFYQFNTNFTSKTLGSSHSFNTYHIDLRKYLNLGNNNILALQVYSRLTFGNSPFQAKAYYGGADVARGYFKGRYIDDHLYVVQMEYRLPIGRRWEVAAFALTGNVGHNESGYGLFDDYKTSFGAGPRYFLYKNKRTLLRLDIGMNKDGQGGIYFGVNEAF